MNKRSPPTPSRQPQDSNPAPSFELMFDAGRWFQFPKCLLFARIAGPDGKLRALEYGACLFLAFLINHHCKIRSARRLKSKPYDGWFYCGASTIQKQLGMTKDGQAGYLKRLKSYGLLATKIKGGPPSRRYIQLDEVAIARSVSHVEAARPIIKRPFREVSD